MKRPIFENQPAARVLDFGAGSGILAFAAAKLGAERIAAIECDGEALENYHLNAELNGVADRIDYRIGSSERIGEGETFDLAVCNALFDRVAPHFARVLDSLAVAGLFIYSGYLESQQAEVAAHLDALGFAAERLDREDEWLGGIFRRKA